MIAQTSIPYNRMIDTFQRIKAGFEKALQIQEDQSS